MRYLRGQIWAKLNPSAINVEFKIVIILNLERLRNFSKNLKNQKFHRMCKPVNYRGKILTRIKNERSRVQNWIYLRKNNRGFLAYAKFGVDQFLEKSDRDSPRP